MVSAKLGKAELPLKLLGGAAAEGRVAAGFTGVGR
jgi:hypothetical protein